MKANKASKANNANNANKANKATTARQGHMPLTDDVARYEQLMERLMIGFKARMMQVCKAGDLTPPQFFALMTICRLGRTKMSPLGDELGLSMGAASTLIDRLVTRGLVTRDADPSDRRAVFVCLSPKGEEVLAEAKAARRVLLSQVFDQLDQDERSRVLASLETLAGAWDALPPVGHAGHVGLACIVEE